MNLKYSYLKTSNIKLPYLEAKSNQVGPTIWLTGAIHGDEVGGTLVIQELFKRLQKHKIIKGAIKAFPLLNPLGVIKGARGIGKNNEDLNRAFPGNKKGTQAEKLAHIIFTEIKQSKPDLVIDIHNDWLNTLPYIEIDPNPGSKNKKGYKQAKILAAKLDLPIVSELKQAAQVQKLHKSLSGSLLSSNIPALTLEFGGSKAIFPKKNLADGVQSIWNLLTHLKMVAPQKNQFHFRIPLKYRKKILSYSHQPTATTKGSVKFLVKPGTVVKKGQPVAQVLNTARQIQETLRNRHQAIVLGHADSSVAYPGAELISLGILQ